MSRVLRTILAAIFAVTACLGAKAAPADPQAAATEAKYPPTTEGDFVVHNFKFKSGQSMAEVRLHYTTLGKPATDAQGHTTNAVLILHGTGGSGHQFLAPYFANELFNPGQVLDASRYYLILVDGIGHGKSSKPSDGLHAIVRVGRDVSRFHGRADADGVLAGADRRPQPPVAKDGDGRDSQRSRMEKRRLHFGAAAGRPHRAGFPDHRRQCPDPDAKVDADARRRR